MLLTGLALFLSIIGIAAFPCWRYSSRWGFAPSAVSGMALFFVAVLIVGGKVATSEALAARLTAPVVQPPVELSMIEKASLEWAPAAPSVMVVAGPPIPLRRTVEAPDFTAQRN